MSRSIPAVDLVIAIDTSPSMKDEAIALSQASEAAIERARSSCPSDLRVMWFGIEGTWKGTHFDRTIRNYLVGECDVWESQMRGRKRGEVKNAGAQEDAARAVEDLSTLFNWRQGAARAIFYLGDEALEGGGSKTEREDIEATDVAIAKAQAADVAVHTYFGTSKSKHRQSLVSEYARMASETGGQAFTDKDAIEGFSAVLERVICGTRAIATAPEPVEEPVSKTPTVYVQDCPDGQLSKLYGLDLSTGKTTFVGELVTEVSDIAFVGSQLYGLDLTDSGKTTLLVTINPATGDASVVGDIGFAVVGLAYSDARDTLYASSAKQLIAIDRETGKGTAVVTLKDRDRNCGEVAFDGSGNAYISLIGYDRKKMLATCNLDTGDVSIIGDVGFPGLASMEFIQDVLYGVTGSFFNLGKDGQLICIDTKTGKGTFVAMTDPIARWAGITLGEPVRTDTTPDIVDETPEVHTDTTPDIVDETPEVHTDTVPDAIDETPEVHTDTVPDAIDETPEVDADTTPDIVDETPEVHTDTTPDTVDEVDEPAQPMPKPAAPIYINALTFDSFDRNPATDIVCVAPVRTVVRREEEIVLIRRVRKVEEIDASPACPVNTSQVSQGE
ncbi:hypothetical protein IQ235_05825 [Oscillatoriales cyanobacterium LEGE 11467]|uniref:VWFA domain-containing protein n=1 Tax=Zarconia navalis LEGE 11467 TaxID=1828826 RepID=A0A928VZ09_9CYAN|nr:hypothetical protein [Zarconia navalis]MBE9040310.1 hypothetical protein [Zarconia navalis LEGE 11467]